MITTAADGNKNAFFDFGRGREGMATNGVGFCSARCAGTGLFTGSILMGST